MDDQGGGKEGTFAKEDVDSELDCQNHLKMWTPT